MNQPTPPPTIDLLQQQLAALQQVLAETRQALEDARRENTLLRQKLDALARRFFGKQSEQLSDAQLELLLKGLDESSVELPVQPPSAKASPAPRRPNTQSQRLRTPDHLEVVQVVIVRWSPKTGPPIKMDFWRSAGEKTADYESKTQTA